jgi:hypothetical protein
LDKTFFLGIGAQKAGTSWLHGNLASHPQVHVPPFKELHYFDTAHGLGKARVMARRRRVLENVQQRAGTRWLGRERGRRQEWYARFVLGEPQDDAWYASLFSPGPTQRAYGEITPAYGIIPEEGVAHVKRFRPDARIIYIMRDPVERAISVRKMHFGKRLTEGDAPSAEEWLHSGFERDPQLDQSRYDLVVPKWERHFGGAILFLFYDDIGKGAEYLERVCAHLGVDYRPDYFPRREEQIGVSVNFPVPDGVRQALARKYLATAQWTAERFGAVTETWLARIADLAKQPAAAATPRAQTRRHHDTRGLLRGVRPGPARHAPHRFVLLAEQRTGSNMVVSALKTHPAVFCHGELFRPLGAAGSAFAGGRAIEFLDSKFHSEEYRRKHYAEFLEAIFGLDYDYDFVGFKLLLHHNPAARDLLIADPRCAKVLLYRDNLLACYSSHQIAGATGQGAAGRRAVVRTAKIEFRSAHFERYRRRREALYAETRTKLKSAGQPYLDISYLEACEPDGIPRILAAIGADPAVMLTTATQKRNPSDILARFSNPEAVEAWLRANGLEHWRYEQITA